MSRQSAQIMTFVLFLRFKHSPQHPVLKHLQFMLRSETIPALRSERIELNPGLLRKSGGPIYVTFVGRDTEG